MYSQYQNFQQPSTAAQTSAMSWNGSAWVSAPANSFTPVQSSTYSTYQQQPAVEKPGSMTVIPPNPVQTFTEYYHSWQAHTQTQEQYLQQLPFNSPLRAEAQRRVDWAKYYVDRSSRAAHYFHQNPNATVAPFDLPPSPTDASSTTSTTTTTPTVIAAAATATDDAAVASSKGGLKRYVQNCLGQCATPDAKKSMQSQVEQVIAKAIQESNLHSKNWDAEPLLLSLLPPLSLAAQARSAASAAAAAATATAGSVHFRIQKQAQHKSPPVLGIVPAHHGPGGTTTTPNSNKYSNNYYGNHSQTNNSYYGNSNSNSSKNNNNNNTTPNRRASNQSNNSNSSYYGPNTTNSSLDGDASFSLPTQPNNINTNHNHYNKRAVANDDFIPLSNKKQKKDKNGLDRSNTAMAKRANRFSGQGGILDASTPSVTVQDIDKYMGKRMIGGSSKQLDETDFEQMTVKGTCQVLEKEYLRLTAPPRAKLVRPQPILEQHLANLLQEYPKKKSKRHDYLWFCSQLKSMRQDCTVQRIQNAFAVQVYETHARIALQEGDINEYNQCQTQLKELFDQLSAEPKAVQNMQEFLAYRLLYYIFLITTENYNGGSSDLFNIMLSLTLEQRQDPAIRHALQVREAVSLGDYTKFFGLHETAPNLGRFLTERMVATMRMRALMPIAKAYRPSVELEFVLRQLGFAADSKKGKQWLISCGCVMDGDQVMTKDTVVHEPIVETKNSLI
jgi:hypothetical protein